MFQTAHLKEHCTSPKQKKLALLWTILMLIFSTMLFNQLTTKPLPIETNIMALLPKNQQDPRAQIAFDRIASTMSNKVIFLVGSKDPETTIQATKAFEQSLDTMTIQKDAAKEDQAKTEDPKPALFSNIDGQVTQDAQQEWGKFFFPYRFQLLTQEQQQRLQQDPNSQTDYVIQSVYSPFSGVTGGELQNDSFLLFRDYLKQLTANSGNFRLSDGYLTTEYQNKHYALISADLNGSAYNMKLQRQLPELIKLEQTLKSQFNNDLEVLHTGVIFYAEHGTQSAKSEISTIGVGSLIGVVLLILLVYRSAMPLTLALLSIGCGLVAAFVVTSAVFGRVHLFSLVFGASLIGVSIDYAFHYLTDRLAAGNRWQATKGLKHIFMAITLGLVTSLIGYLGMLIAPFPGLQQLALFSAIGLFAAYATVVCWYPVLAASPSAAKKLPLSGLLRLWLRVWQNRPLRIILPVTLIIISFFGVRFAKYNDDIRQLQAMPENLKQQEQLIKTISGVQHDQQMLLVNAHSEQDLLDKLGDLSTQLNQQVKRHHIDGYQSITQFIPSIEQQKRNFALTQSLYQTQAEKLQARLQLKTLPTMPAQFHPLDIDDFLASSISKPVQFMWLGNIQGQASALVTLNGVHNESAIEKLASQQGISYLNKTKEISELFGLYRVHVSELLSVATILILLVVSIRYGVKQGILIVLPPLIAGAIGVSVSIWLNGYLNLFNLLALVLVLGIGIDYTLFFAEQSLKQERAWSQSTNLTSFHSEQALAIEHSPHTTLLAISLSALTTILSFGLLALSQTQAIHNFGITVLFGILVSWMLAPLAMKPTEY
ncbi:MAG: MMPL family transporter [Vibrio sp.]